MNLRQTYQRFDPSAAVRNDLTRLERLWDYAAARASSGPWLFGAYSLADVFFAPVAMRLAAYQLPIGAQAQTYVATHLNDGAIRRWRARAFAEGTVQPHYEFDLDTGPWPGPPARPAAAVTGETPINDRCPFSGKPVASDSLARIDGTVVGFCNQFCRDKAAADPDAWPALVALLDETAEPVH